MPYQPNELLASHFKNEGIDLDHIDQQLNLVAANSPNLPLYRDMMLTVLRMAHDDSNRWNAKITLQALRELDHAFRVLEQFKGRRKVTVFGSARTPVEHPLYGMARELGAALARSDLMVITGAGGGIMAAAHEGAGLTHSLGFNITLPFEQRANDVVHDTGNLLPFHFFFLRKLFFVKEADALVLCLGDLQVDLARRRATRAGQRIDLSAKEFQLLTLLLRRKGEVLSRTEIAEQVWDVNFDHGTNVIDVAVRRLRSKLDLPFERPLLHTVRGMGYVLEDRQS